METRKEEEEKREEKKEEEYQTTWVECFRRLSLRRKFLARSKGWRSQVGCCRVRRLDLSSSVATPVEVTKKSVDLGVSGEHHECRVIDARVRHCL